MQQQNQIQQDQAQQQDQSQQLDQTQQQSPTTKAISDCHLTGTYKKGTSFVSCSSVPAGITMGLSLAKTGATIEFVGTSRFGTLEWEGA
ncbi:putative polygalacturonase [Phytophthora cinnamomi]|uniref:putative polygalacturonase n=1 Tax=Phytophthora cinnamomi TaxID=4785 RepID=UPI0035594D8F|nr:putative polygalacturonase [Phytophthora cinnamomi]UKP15090.1 polygalacturonase [Phytophthora cinnamomi]